MIIIYNDNIICYLNLLIKKNTSKKYYQNIIYCILFLHFFIFILIFNFIKKKINFIIL